MSDIWHQPESLENGPPPRRHHTTAYVIALVVLVALGGAIARIATSGTSQHNGSPTVSGLPLAPTPSGSTGPDTQETPPLATPSPNGSLPPAPGGTPMSTADYRKVMTRAGDAGSVHSISDQTLQNGVEVRFDDLDGATGGSQRITIDTAVALVRVVGYDTYFRGSTRVLAGFFGTTAQTAISDGNRWIHLVPGDRGYGSVTENVTLASTLAEDVMAGPFARLAPQLKDGVRAYGIQGRPAHTNGAQLRATLWVAVSGDQLPVEFDLEGSGLSSVQRFTDWGAAVHVTAPPDSVDGHGAFPPHGGSSTGPGVPV